MILLLASTVTVVAQQDPLYSQYLNNPLVINPAYTGLTDNLNAAVGFRKQWAGFDGSPTTFNATGHISLFDNKMGVGLILLNDKVGSNSTTEVHGTYAYQVEIDNMKLSMGLQAGVINFQSDNGDLNPYDPDDYVFAENQSITKPSFGIGAILTNDRFFAGISVPRLLKSKSTIGDLDATLYNQHFYATAAYIVFLSDRIRFKPSLLIKAVSGSPVSVDYNLSLNIDEKITAGAFTRNFNTYGLLAGLRITDMLRFGYVFEVPTDKSVGAQFTSHEVTLGLSLAVFDFHDRFMSSF